MTQIKEVNEQAYDWLMNTVDQNAWCKHAFSHYPKCDLLWHSASDIIMQNKRSEWAQ